MAKPSKLPTFREIRSRDSFVLVAMCFALFTDTFVYGMIIPILPSLLAESGIVSNKKVQKWMSLLLAIYGAALLLGSPLIGWLSDRYRSRKKFLIFGLVTFGLATALFMLSRHPSLLVLARVAQGVSGAVVGVLGLTMIAETAREEKVGKYMAYGSLALTWGIVSGPMIGGLMFDKFGHMATFALPIALLAVDIVLRLLIIEEKPLEYKGESTSSEQNGSAVPKGATPAAAAGGGGANGQVPTEESPLIDHELGSRAPETLSLKDFFHPHFLAVCFAVLMVSCVLSAFETTLPLFVMDTYDWTASGAGLIFLPLSLPSLLSIWIGESAGRFGARNIVMGGFCLAFVPLVFLRYTQTDTMLSQVLLAGLLFCTGCCLMTVQALTMAEVSHAVRAIAARRNDIKIDENTGMGQGYAFCNMAFAGGQFLGPVIGGVVKLNGGWPMCTLILGVLCLIAAVPALWFSNGDKSMSYGKANGYGSNNHNQQQQQQSRSQQDEDMEESALSAAANERA